MTRHAPAPVLALVALIGSLLSATQVSAQAIEWWQKDFDGALAAAKDSTAELLLLYCWQDDHEQCSSMFSGTLSDDKVGKALVGVVCMGAKNDDTGKPVWQRYGIQKVPTVLFVDPAGTVVDVLPGYVPVDRFVKEVERIRAGKDTIAALRQQVAASPKDMDLQLKLMQKLRASGDKAGSIAVIDAMMELDPKAKSEAAAEAMLLKLTDETFAPEIEPANYDLDPLRRFLKKQRNKRIQFLGYDRMAAAEYRREDLKAAAAAAYKAWKSIPDDQVIDWAQTVLGLAYQHRDELDKVDKGILKKALVISKKRLKMIEDEQKQTPDKPFLASAQYLHAAMLLVNKKRSQALDLMEEAIANDPKNEGLKKARDAWLAGEK